MASYADLAGVRVLVTGASRGLGRAMAVSLAEAGADVVVTGRDVVALHETVAAVAVVGRTAHPYALEITDAAATEALVAAVELEHGPLDVVFANAGISLFKAAADTSMAEFDEVLRTNVLGTFNTVRAVGSRLRQRGSGKIVTVSSDLGLRGGENWIAYGASKAAVVNLTKSLAWEWAPSVTVNCLAPGAFATDINAHLLSQPGVSEGVSAATPLGRIGRAEEIGAAAVFLASSGSDFMTGAVLSVDGGIVRA